MIVTANSFAIFPRCSVEGPCIGSARLKRSVSSRWQKYCERNISGRQIIFAPFPAASRTNSPALCKLSSTSADIAICTNPIVNLSLVLIFLEYEILPAMPKLGNFHLQKLALADLQQNFVGEFDFRVRVRNFFAVLFDAALFDQAFRFFF